MRPLLTQFESRKRAPGLGGLNSFRLVPRSPSSFVLCGAPAPNGSFVNHQQLFGSVCKTGGLRITALFLGTNVPNSENTSVSLQGKESCGGNPKCLFNVVAL